MRSVVLLLAAALPAALPAAADPAGNAPGETAETVELVTVPSGQEVALAEVIRDAKGPRGLTWRFRFVAPAIARKSGTVAFAQAAADMDYLCNFYALPRLPQPGPRPGQVIISLSDQPIGFGVADPKITQFFEAYAIAEDGCKWDGL